MKILLYDIETSPNLAYVWGMHEQDVIDVEKPWEILCFSYQWLGEKTIHTESQRTLGSEKKLIKALWQVLNEADVVIAHNGDRFDNKKANGKFLQYGLTPPKPYQSIDTLKIARSKFALNSNRLNDLAKLLGVETKAETGGFATWKGCMAGERKAWNKMEGYNAQDVVVLEQVYLKLRPWAKTHPNVGGRNLSCPKCGSARLVRRGLSSTRANVYRRYQCKDCGGWARGAVVEKEVPKYKAVNE